jgi:hypothetical protein
VSDRNRDRRRHEAAGRITLGSPDRIRQALPGLTRLQYRTLLALIVLQYEGTEAAERAQRLLDDDLRLRGAVQ